MFGSDGLIDHPNDIRTNILMTSGLHPLTKYIVNTKFIDKSFELNIHTPNNQRRYKYIIENNLIHLNHYPIQSKEYFTKIKMTLIKKIFDFFLLSCLGGLKSQRLFNKNYAMHNFYPTTRTRGSASSIKNDYVRNDEYFIAYDQNKIIKDELLKMLILNDYIFCDNVINDELLKLLILHGYNNIITFDDLITLNYCNNNYNDKFLMMYIQPTENFILL